MKVPLLIAGLLLSMNSFGQIWQIDSLSAPSNALACNPINITVHGFLQCINYQFDSVSYSISNDTIRVGAYYTGGPCAGALSWPVHPATLNSIPTNSYTIITTGYLNLQATNSVIDFMNVNSCCSAVPSFSSSTNLACPDDTVYFTNTSTNQTGQIWYVDGVAMDTSLDFQYAFPGGGPYSVTMTAIGSGCRDSVNENISMRSLPIPDIGNDTSVCGNMGYVFDAGSQWDYVVWNTGDTVDALLVDSSGLYIATVYDNDGCWNSDSATFTALDTPTVDLGPADTFFCVGTTLLLDAGNPGSSYLWSTGDTTQTLVVSMTNGYTVNVTGSNGCSTIDSIFAFSLVCGGLQNSLANSYSFYPNPTTEYLLIKGEGLGEVSIKLFDPKGVEEKISYSFLVEDLRIDTRDLKPGLHFLEITNESEKEIFRIIKE